MDVELVGDPADFLAATAPLRAQDPVLTNVVGSVALDVAAGARHYERCWWWVVSERGTVVGAALRTAPFSLLVSPMPEAAARALAPAVRAVDPDLPGVNGPPGPVGAFLAALSAAGETRHTRDAGHQLVYELGELVVPSVPGSARTAEEADLPLALAWNEAFHAEIGGIHSAEGVTGRIARRMTHLWVDGGEVVALAGHAEPVEVPGGTLTRVGPVYTPPERRRRGYAAAVTAACSAALLERGSRVMLYTDAANPTSNGVYIRLGFEHVGDVVVREFA